MWRRKNKSIKEGDLVKETPKKRWIIDVFLWRHYDTFRCPLFDDLKTCSSCRVFGVLKIIYYRLIYLQTKLIAQQLRFLEHTNYSFCINPINKHKYLLNELFNKYFYCFSYSINKSTYVRQISVVDKDIINSISFNFVGGFYN